MSAALPDAEARERALDLSASFIVRAPAGSGKTSLLVRRFLRALLTVEAPDQVLAVTFTRKAEHEMRERIQGALQDADQRLAAGAPFPADPAQDDHATAFQRDAAAVLAHSKRHAWGLESQPEQLNVRTLDALALDIARRSPLASEFGGTLAPIEDADPVFRRVVRMTLHAATADADEDVDRTGPETADSALRSAVATLLGRHNGRFEWLENTCVALLGRREQWLPFLGDLTDAALGEMIATSREALRSALLQRALAALDGSGIESIAAAMLKALGRLEPGAAAAPEAWPAPTLAALPSWGRIAHVLLTGQGTLRKRLTRREGFPADARADRDAVLAWIGSLPHPDRVAAALSRLVMLADSSTSADELEALHALGILLRRLAAALRLEFGREGVCDFIENGLGALRALDRHDYVPDRFRHVLVDEYQDTSRIQSTLLARLVDDWQDGDGRTLFLVGDPMQSIYRFRQAEVGVFLRTETDGIAGVRPMPLQLRANFRSAPPLVNWFNETFRGLLPDRSDPLTGAVAFAAAESVREIAGQIVADWRTHDDPEGGVTGSMLAAAGSARVVAHVARIRAANPGESIGILVRTNAAARSVAAGLAAAAMPFELEGTRDPLERDVVLDLFMLWRAVNDWADRPAWFATLRGPLVGLSTRALLRIAAAAGEGEQPAIPTLLERLDMEQIEPSRAPAVARLLCGLDSLRTHRWLRPPGTCLQMLWQHMGGMALVEQREDLLRLRGAFAMLDRPELRDADVDDVERALRRLGVDPEPQAAAPAADVSVLTVHRAKGLEWDHVVLAHLETGPRGSEPSLLRWMVTDQGLQLALRSPQGESANGVYQQLGALESEQAAAELLRLAYVAATRARRSLTLVADTRISRSGSPAIADGSLLRAFRDRMTPTVADPTTLEAAAIDETSRESGPGLVALPATFDPPVWSAPSALAPWTGSRAPDVFEPIDPSARTARELGIVVHRLLQWLLECAADGAAAPDTASMRAAARRSLRARPLTHRESTVLAPTLDSILESLTSCPVLAWMRRQDIVGIETGLAWTDGRVLRADLVLRAGDHSLWVIDHKTVWPAPDEAALALQRDRYAEQLARYAQALAQASAGATVRTALYFPGQSVLWEVTEDGGGPRAPATLP